MTAPDDVRVKFERYHGITWEAIQSLPIGTGSRIHLENDYKRHLETWQAAQAAQQGQDSEVICPHCERLTDIRHCRACGCDFINLSQPVITDIYQHLSTDSDVEAMPARAKASPTGKSVRPANMILQRAIDHVHMVVTSSHLHGWKENREAWFIIQSHIHQQD